MFAGSVSQAQSVPFKTLLMPGPVSQPHVELENECGKCHATFQKTSQTQLCLDCHEDVAKDIAAQSGLHGRSQDDDQECTACHGEHQGRDADITGLDRSGFDHSKTDFELTGKHLTTLCGACHMEDKKYREATQSCESCHEHDDAHGGSLGSECADCHSPASWTETSFDHGDTDYVLAGRHQEVQCGACHPDQRYENTPQTCVDCHRFDDVHAGRNGQQCANCHRESGWDKLAFDHGTDTDFPLLGSHKTLECKACHVDSVTEDTAGTACIDCHRSDDVHRQTQGESCETCHSEQQWTRVSFDHDKDTDFQLRGQHSDVSCESCHHEPLEKNQEIELGSACIACHEGDDTHVGQEGNQCQSCHSEENWRTVKFNHDLTRFPLVGMHNVVACENCHLSNAFKDAETGCDTCHAADDYHEQTLGVACGNCHNPNDWGLWLFDHDEQTNFPLDGEHTELACADCHTTTTNSQIKQSNQCVSCHEADDIHNRRFGRTCDRCHTTTGFRDLRMQ